MGFWKKVVDLLSDLGEWIELKSKKKSNAIILVIISIFSPVGFVFASSMIAHAYRKDKRNDHKPKTIR